MSALETSPRVASPKQSPRIHKNPSTESDPAAASSSELLQGILRVSSISSRPSSTNSSSPRSPRDRRASKRLLSTANSKENVPGKDKITFADQHGSKLDENHFVERLHYSDTSVDMTGQLQTRSCCVIT